MANRRMFSLDVIDTDNFSDMPLSAQALYFHLGLRADDDGFVSSARKITNSIGAAADDLRLLASKGYILPFQSGVVVVTHWKMNNYIPKDRYKPTLWQEEKALLQTQKNGLYTHCIQDVHILDTQDRLGKDRLGKDRLGKDRLGKDRLNNNLGGKNDAATPKKQSVFVPPTIDEVTAYRESRGAGINPQEFIDFYESKGWMVGKVKMKDWKAAYRRADKWGQNGDIGIRSPEDYSDYSYDGRSL